MERHGLCIFCKGHAQGGISGETNPADKRVIDSGTTGNKKKTRYKTLIALPGNYRNERQGKDYAEHPAIWIGAGCSCIILALGVGVTIGW